MKNREVVKKYQLLIQKYTDGELSASDFSLQYLGQFKNETSKMSEKTYQILQELFRHCDAYCEDPNLRRETIDGIGEDELMEASVDAANKLEERLKSPK